MDVDVHWVYHRRVRRLQRLYPDRWPCYWAAYMALLGEAWARGTRDMVLEDHAGGPERHLRGGRRRRQVAAGVLDSRDASPRPRGRNWFGPAAARMEGYRKGRCGLGFGP
jgi:hypothetical protein